MRKGDPSLKIAIRKPGQPIALEDLHSKAHVPTDSEIAELRQVFETYLPGAVGQVTETKTCLYTNSAVGHFIHGQHPTDDKITIAAGFSGHGFKFATVIGEALPISPSQIPPIYPSNSSPLQDSTHQLPNNLNKRRQTR